MSSDKHLFDIAFASLRGMNIAIARQLAELAPNVDSATFFSLTQKQLIDTYGIAPAIFSDKTRQQALDSARSELNWIKANNVRCIAWSDEGYPARLLECEDAPLMLFAIGNTNLDADAVLSVVGTRRATVYGTAFVDKCIADLAQRLDSPPVIISGLAIGIDIAAHRAAISAGCPTVAVMATGLNTIYPACHRREAKRIIDNGGMIISEYRSVDPIHRGNFLARNRIVAGLADVTLLAESAVKGGAMTTARLAADYNRVVAALPGRHSDRYSRGCNALIASSQAALVQSADDIIALTPWKTSSRPEAEPVQQTLFPQLDSNAQSIIDIIRQYGELHQNEISALLNMPFHTIAAALMDLEFRQLIAQIPGGKYTLIS